MRRSEAVTRRLPSRPIRFQPLALFRFLFGALVSFGQAPRRVGQHLHVVDSLFGVCRLRYEPVLDKPLALLAHVSELGSHPAPILLGHKRLAPMLLIGISPLGLLAYNSQRGAQRSANVIEA